MKEERCVLKRWKYNFCLNNALPAYSIIYFTLEMSHSRSLSTPLSCLKKQIEERVSIFLTFPNQASTNMLHQFDLGELQTEVTWGSLLAINAVLADLKNKKKESSAELKEWEKHISLQCGLTNGKPLSAVMRSGYEEGWPVIHPFTWQISCLLVVWVIFFFRKVWRWSRTLSWGKHI